MRPREQDLGILAKWFANEIRLGGYSLNRFVATIQGMKDQDLNVLWEELQENPDVQPALEAEMVRRGLITDPQDDSAHESHSISEIPF